MRILLIPGILILLTIASCKNGKSDLADKKGKPPVTVDVIVAAKTDISSDIEVNGTVLSEEMIELRPEVSGRLTYLNIPDGAVVAAGAILARINDADLQAQLQQQKVQLELAEKTEKRLNQLLTANGVDQATYDAALSQVNLYNANINVLKAQIDKTVIRAPFSGRLGLRLVSEGAYVSPSTTIGTLQQTDRIKIDFSVPETYADLLKVGRTIAVKATSSGEEMLATVSAVEPQISTATRNIKVRARLNGGMISPGSFVKVILNKSSNGIVVPTNAIIPDAMSNLVVLVKDGKATFQPVETGIRDNNGIEITKGLQVGDTVIVSGVLFVRPNGPVKIRSVKAG
ncbi:MAG: efflux RND transporter periplasmic adaptor subunit [Bacteroidales bacterium]|nr:efflux RND transporter periplasmic adaptor subunit [Bacteroidales bacterium]